jgi:GNAT superfamily N-acetyltransferase
MNDTDKLNLILEHAEEYFEDKRMYHFVKDGFVSYELYISEGCQTLYIADIFVSLKARGGNVFKELLKFCLDTEVTHGVKIAYAKTEKQNKYLPNLQRMYERIGFKIIREDDTDIYYRLDV